MLLIKLHIRIAGINSPLPFPYCPKHRPYESIVHTSRSGHILGVDEIYTHWEIWVAVVIETIEPFTLGMPLQFYTTEEVWKGADSNTSFKVLHNTSLLLQFRHVDYLGRGVNCQVDYPSQISSFTECTMSIFTL